ncbi:MAG TPA: TIM44-like domain-containing protein [Candidatus Dormibacteraeota bacterium]|nr:TIM44-like domain-containing protein [Candidatus Dormibacteraeota bacterium]
MTPELIAWLPERQGGGQSSSAPSAGGHGFGGSAGISASAGSRNPAAGYDDTHPVGVPDVFGGATLEGTHPAASGPVEDVQGGLAAIAAHDHAFNEEAFLGQAQASFFTIQQAWMECRPEMSRAVMADGLAQQTAMQLAEYVRDNRRNRLDGLTVANATVVGAHSDATYDTITVRFSCASADYDVDATSGRRVRGWTDVRPWTEDWIFQRSSSATTRVAGLMSHACPNCGAPINVNAQGVCEYCGQQVMSGRYDWVLSRIDQR